MSKFKLVCLVACLIFSLAVFSGLIEQQVAAAKSKELSTLTPISSEQASPPKERVELSVKLPILSGEAESSFMFNVNLSYTGGEEPKLFDLHTEGPADWMTWVQTSTGQRIPAIELDPEKTYPETIVVYATGLLWKLPEPDEYTIRLEVAGHDTGEPRDSRELTAIVTSRTDFLVKTTSGRLNIKAKAGKESYLSVIVTNIGSTVLDKVTFSSSNPEEWSITFKPEKIESLSPDRSEEIEVAIKPPSETIAGDYMVTLRFDSDPKPSVTELPELDIRVMVSTPTKWGWIGIGIVIAVIAGLAVTFTRLGRR